MDAPFYTQTPACSKRVDGGVFYALLSESEALNASGQNPNNPSGVVPSMVRSDLAASSLKTQNPMMFARCNFSNDDQNKYMLEHIPNYEQRMVTSDFVDKPITQPPKRVNAVKRKRRVMAIEEPQPQTVITVPKKKTFITKLFGKRVGRLFGPVENDNDMAPCLQTFILIGLVFAAVQIFVRAFDCTLRKFTSTNSHDTICFLLLLVCVIFLYDFYWGHRKRGHNNNEELIIETTEQ